MKLSTHRPPPEPDPGTGPEAGRRRRSVEVVAALAGPALVVAAVLVVLRDFAFRGLLTPDDVETFFLPTYCLLGRSLAAGHVPAWNPYVMGGVPFAADPQSGWMYAPAMLLFTVLPCAAAIRWMIVLQPILAGLGIYWFLRAEGASRPAAATGGVALALVISGAELAVSLPFAGMLAWTSVLLAVMARLFRSRIWPGRLGWSLGVAAAWGQLAAAHMGIGLLMGTAIAAVYGCTRIWLDARDGRVPARVGLGAVGLAVASMVTVNLAFFLPRLAYLPQTSVSMGYGQLQSFAATLSGRPPPPFQMGGAADPGWPLKLATTPGAHLGALALGLAFSGLWSKRYRAMTIVLLVAAAFFFALSLRAVAIHVPPSMRSIRLVDAYLHRPEWFAFPILIILAVLAGFGVEAWREQRSASSRLLMVAPAVLVWGVLPAAAGAGGHRLLLLVGGALVGSVVLVAGVRRPILLALVPVVLALELTANGMHGYAAQPFGRLPRLFRALPQPALSTAALTTESPIASELSSAPPEAGRYVQVRQLTPTERRMPGSTNLLPNYSMLFRYRDVGAYNPVQLSRFWSFVRGTDRVNIKYNAANFKHPGPAVLDLLQIGFVATPAGRPVEDDSEPLATDGRWVLWSRADPPPRAEAVMSWRMVDGKPEALEAVAAPGFDPSGTVILEPGKGVPPPMKPAAGPSSIPANYRADGTQHGVIEVEVPRRAIVLVRTPFERNWHALVDGRPAPVLPADYLVQGVPVGPGRHVIDLSYDDPWIGYGLLGSGLSVVALLTAALMAARIQRRPGAVQGEGGVASDTSEGTDRDGAASAIEPRR